MKKDKNTTKNTEATNNVSNLVCDQTVTIVRFDPAKWQKQDAFRRLCNMDAAVSASYEALPQAAKEAWNEWREGLRALKGAVKSGDTAESTLDYDDGETHSPKYAKLTKKQRELFSGHMAAYEALIRARRDARLYSPEAQIRVKIADGLYASAPARGFTRADVGRKAIVSYTLTIVSGKPKASITEIHKPE